MKKIVLNISDSMFEKLRFESIMQEKSISEIIAERITYKPFHDDVETAFDDFLEMEMSKIISGD